MTRHKIIRFDCDMCGAKGITPHELNRKTLKDGRTLEINFTVFDKKDMPMMKGTHLCGDCLREAIQMFSLGEEDD